MHPPSGADFRNNIAYRVKQAIQSTAQDWVQDLPTANNGARGSDQALCARQLDGCVVTSATDAPSTTAPPPSSTVPSPTTATSAAPSPTGTCTYGQRSDLKTVYRWNFTISQIVNGRATGDCNDDGLAFDECLQNAACGPSARSISCSGAGVSGRIDTSLVCTQGSVSKCFDLAFGYAQPCHKT